MIYLDNSATTRCFDEVTDCMADINRNLFGNPSSMHIVGINAENAVKEAKEIIAKELKVDPKEIFFTSGGTESDNLALIGCARANARAGKHLITTSIEHPAILETMKYLESEGFEVTYLGVDSFGRVDPAELKKELRSDTILVSIMHVNNEIGAIEPIEECARVIKEFNPMILLHVDAVQSFGKLKIAPKKIGVDMLSVSGHKIHGPKGVGILYISDKVKIRPVIFGGGQQKGLRSGTENVPGIAGIAKATQLIYKDHETKTETLYELKERFIEKIIEIEGVTVNGIPSEGVRKSAPHIISASFDGVRAEVLLHALEDKGIFVSAGSACASNKPAISATLKAIGLKKELLDSTVRFSMSVETTEEDIDTTVTALSEIVPMLRRFTRH